MRNTYSILLSTSPEATSSSKAPKSPYSHHPIPIPHSQLIPHPHTLAKYPAKMCKTTYNETKCTHCKKLVKSGIDQASCSKVLASSTLTFGGCKAGTSSVTNKKEEGICETCEVKLERIAIVFRSMAMGG